MSDLSPADSRATTPPTLDTNVIPLGERALRGILDHVIAVGDEAETTYLEVKSPLDMGSKTTASKVAKFLLGAANRRPREAAQHFQGYAVLVIGAQKGEAPGVPRGTEPHELEDRLRPYLGSQFPAFEFARIGVTPDHEVLFVIAQPPEDGQTIFPCHKDFHGDERRDRLEDGAIYVRGTSNTRPARSGEVLALVERARGGGKPPIDLAIELTGSVHRVERVEEVLGQLREFREQEFIKASAKEATSALGLVSLQLGSGFFGAPERLSPEERDQALAAWKSKSAEQIAKGREHFLGVGLPGMGIRVTSRGRFVAKPHLTITFHDCELLDHLDQDDADFDKVVEPVVRKHNPFASSFDPSALRLARRDYPVAWEHRGRDSVVVLTPESFRPDVPWASDDDDYVVIARDAGAESVAVSWILTEDGNDEAITGELRVPAERRVDAADLIRSVFFKDN